MRTLFDWIDRKGGRIFYRLWGTLSGAVSLALGLSAAALFRAGRWEGLIPLLGASIFGALTWYCWRPGRRLSDSDDW